MTLYKRPRGVLTEFFGSVIETTPELAKNPSEFKALLSNAIITIVKEDGTLLRITLTPAGSKILCQEVDE